MLAGWELGDKPPDSVLEPALARVLLRHGLPTAVFHRRVRAGGRVFEVDFAYPELRIVIEVDGWQHHGRRDAFERDRARDAALVAAGWVVLRFTWLQVTRRPAWVAAQIAATLAVRSAA